MRRRVLRRELSEEGEELLRLLQETGVPIKTWTGTDTFRVSRFKKDNIREVRGQEVYDLEIVSRTFQIKEVK